jgi:hypothetical protein
MAQGDELTREEVEATLKWLEEWEKVNEDKRYTLFEKYYMERASRRRRNKGHHR